MRNEADILFKNNLPTNLKQKFAWRFLSSFPLYKAIVSLYLITIVSLVSVFTLPVSASHTRVWLNGYQNPGIVKPLNAIAGKPVTIYVMVSDIDDSDGLAGFEFTLNYDHRLVTIPDTDGDNFADEGYVNWQNPGVWTTFPATSGRGSLCSQAIIHKSLADANRNQIAFTCGTNGISPSAPQGSGVLASVTFETQKGNVGQTNINFVNSQLVELTADANPITHTKSNGILGIYKCADLDGNNTVTVGDIGKLIQVFGTTTQSPNWNENADLDASGSVTVGDIGIAVSQFGQSCS